MKKWILFPLLLLALVGAGCADKATTAEKEWEPGDSIAFCDPGLFDILYSIPLTEGIEMPEWLAVKVREFETWVSTYPDGRVLPPNEYRLKVFRIEWKNHIFYYIYNVFSSTPISNIFYENGDRAIFKWIDDPNWQEDDDSFCADSENWTLIHDYGEFNL